MKNLQSYELFEFFFDRQVAKTEMKAQIGKAERIFAEADEYMKDLTIPFDKKHKEFATALSKYSEMLDRAKKMVTKLKKVKIENSAQNKALRSFVSGLDDGLKNLRKIHDKLEANNEGLLDFIGELGIKVITFIKNMLTNIKQNMTDTYTDMHRLEDVFDMRGTSGHWYGRWQ